MGETARFWHMTLDQMARMPKKRYQRYLDHYMDFLEYQEEAYERAKSGDDGEEVTYGSD